MRRSRCSCGARRCFAADSPPQLPGNVTIAQKLNTQHPARPHVPRRAGEGRPAEASTSTTAGRCCSTSSTSAARCSARWCSKGTTTALTQLKFDIGKEFDVITVSIDPRDKAADAAQLKEKYIRHYGRLDSASGWHFLTAHETAIKKLTDAVGFQYAYDSRTDQFAHGAALLVLTPDGRISRYFYGFEYKPRDLRLAIVEASAGKVGTLTDQFLLLCFHYDPATGKYSRNAMMFARAGGVTTMLALGGFIFVMFRKERTTTNERFPAVSRAGFERRAARRRPVSRSSSSSPARVSLLIWLVIFYFAIKYRRRPDNELAQEQEPPAILEMTWTVVPPIIFIGIFVAGAWVFFRMQRVPAQRASRSTPPAGSGCGSSSIRPGSARSTTLHVPVGRPVKITMASEDVIHSLWFPAFRVKTDVLPNRYRTMWFEATKTGTLPHLLRRVLRHAALGDDRLGRWSWSRPNTSAGWPAAREGSLASQGEKLFQKYACNTCHMDDGTGRGPVLAGSYGKTRPLADGSSVVADDNYIRESILNPQAKIAAGFQPIMPTFQGQVSEEDLIRLLAYVKSMPAPQTDAPVESAQSSSSQPARRRPRRAATHHHEPIGNQR